MVPIIRYRNDASMFSPSEVKNRVEAGRDGGLGDMGQSDSSVLSGDFFPNVGQVTQLFIFMRGPSTLLLILEMMRQCLHLPK